MRITLEHYIYRNISRANEYVTSAGDIFILFIYSLKVFLKLCTPNCLLPNILDEIGIIQIRPSKITLWPLAARLKSVTNNSFSNDPVKFREDLMNIARTTLSSKLLTQHKDFFAKMAVDAVLRLKGSGNLEAIQVGTCGHGKN